MRNNRQSTYIIAEIGPNHNGDVNLALQMVEKLAKIGVNAVKFQITVPENAYSLDAFKANYQKKQENSKSPLKMSKKYMLTFEEHRRLYEKCWAYNVDYICSAFEMESLQFIDKNFDLPYYKIPSGEIFSVDLIDYMAQNKKPFILSTGMATYEEIEIAINLINQNFEKDITILHCISNYPVHFVDVNLNVMLELRQRFGYPVGFSDHTVGNDAAIAAVALGASMIEKHVTKDKNLPGPDHKASVTIEEFGQLVQSIRNVEKMMGQTEKIFSDDELKIKNAVRKSLVATKDLPEGHVLSEQDICFKRPGTGILPIHKDAFIGKKIKIPVQENRVIKQEFFFD